MEILQFLISFFVKEYGFEKFLPLFECLKENSFDLKKTIMNIKPEIISPILNEFMQKGQKITPDNNDGGNGLTPILNFADSQVVNALNGYFTH